MGKAGRPKVEIDRAVFEELCAIQCTRDEICRVLGVVDKTLSRWCRDTYGKGFQECYQDKKMGGKASLRRNQWNLSKTNATMAIFLGKQYLGQRDQVDVESHETVTIVDDIPKQNVIFTGDDAGEQQD